MTTPRWSESSWCTTGASSRPWGSSSSGRPKQFLDQNTKTENDTSEKPSFGRNQLIDQTISVLANTVSFGQNNLFWPKWFLIWLFIGQGYYGDCVALFTCGEAYRSRRAFYFHFGGEGGKVNTDLIPTFCNIWSLRSQLGGEGGKVYTDLSRHFVIFGHSTPVVRRFSPNHDLVVKEVRLSQRFVIPPHPTLCMGSLKPR